MYQDLQVERAVQLLRQVISPSSPFEVSREQRVQAYKYLGACLAILGQRDSSIVYFRAALERDAFTDLDARTFTEQERAAFAEARNRTFAVGLRPVTPARIDPSTERVTFLSVTTHSGTLRAELRVPGDTAGLVLFDRESDGLRELTWNGLLADGRLAPPGRYALTLTARSSTTGQSDSARVFFEVRHDRPALEDSISPLRADQLLPERYATSAAPSELAKGLAIALAAVTASSVGGRLGGSRAMAGTVAGTAGATGLAAFVLRQRRREIRENVLENLHRKQERDARNAEIARRNAERLAQTKLVFTPAAGLAQ
jgi:hypothetical protein